MWRGQSKNWIYARPGCTPRWVVRSSASARDAMNCTWRRRRLLSPSLVAILTVGVVAAITAARRVAAVEQPAGKADPHSGEFDYYREWGNKHLAPDHAPDGNDAGAKAVYDEYESFVEGVESVMGDQRAAASKRDVVDLGQSLHLLDTKFEHLKESLYEQMVTAAARRGSKGKGAAVAEGQALARKVKSKYTNVRTIARDVLDLMASNAQAVEHVSETMTGLEKVVGELQKNLEQHHKEVTELGNSVKRLHDSSHSLMDTHASSSHAALSAAQKSTSALQSGAMPSSTKIYFLLLVEMAGLCGFALFRRRRSRVKYSAKLY